MNMNLFRIEPGDDYGSLLSYPGACGVEFKVFNGIGVGIGITTISIDSIHTELHS